MVCQDGQGFGKGRNGEWRIGKNLERFPLGMNPESRNAFVLCEYSSAAKDALNIMLTK